MAALEKWLLIMNIEYWDKEKIKNLTENEKEDWFDVYNHNLEMDRGYNINKMIPEEVSNLRQTIKKDYLDYLESLVNDKSFINYTILYNSGKIVSQCRMIVRDNQIYIAGLETHRDYRQLGFGKKVLLEAITYMFEHGFNSIHSVIRKWNESSLKTHKSVGFNITENKGENYLLSLGNIKLLVKQIIEEFVDKELTKIELLSEKIILLDNQYNFRIEFNEQKYVAKFHSNNKAILTKLLKNIKENTLNKSNYYFESKKYGYIHKYHLYGKEYWLWIEKYI